MTFKDAHAPDNPTPVPGLTDWRVPAGFKAGARGLARLVRDYGGVSFSNGLYRVHPPQDVSHWTAVVEEAFPEFRGRVLCFSCDWLGRQFAVDRARQQGGQFLILMFEPGTGQALEIPSPFLAFHNEELVDHQNEALARQFYESWLLSGGKAPGLTECVGYKTPLFLGGKDAVENLELSDMEVYWHLCGQLLKKVRSLPGGTRIGRIDIA